MFSFNRYDSSRDPEAAIFKPILYGGWAYYIIIPLLSAIVLWALFAYAWQFAYGLGETGLGRPDYWGVYIINFVFFVGISHAGTLISAILRVTQAEWRRPITRCAEAITVFALMVGPINVIIDLGRPDRMMHVFQFGRYQSPLLWDVMAIATYLTGSLVYLYLPLIPDIAMVRDRLDEGDWRKPIYRTMALGWAGTEKQKKRLGRAISIMMVLIIPIAVSVHTVVSWVFAMTIQPMWGSTIFGPYFVVGAIFSGIATLIIAMAILRKVLHLEAYLTPGHFRKLGLLLLAFVIIWTYFTFAEYITVFYHGEPTENLVFNAKVWGNFFSSFWFMILANVVIPFILLAWPRTGRSIFWMAVASLFINMGMWMERYTIVVPTLANPRLPWPTVFYAPSWVEISITAGEFAFFTLLYVLFSRVFPLVSAWELEEGREHQLARAKEVLRTLEPEGERA